MANSKPITLEESLAISKTLSRIDGLMSAEEYHWAVEAREECLAEQQAEGAYERMMDYKAWLRDGWQPAHAF